MAAISKSRRFVAGAGAFALVAAGMLSGAQMAGAEVPAGATKLVQANFDQATEQDPGLRALNDACLTAAAGGSTAPAGMSNLGGCTKVKNAPTTGAAPGFLQLTDASSNSTGGVIYNRPVPGNGGLYVKFDQYQYGGSWGQNTGYGADGISFFLVDGTYDLKKTGAFGGSLGYAQKTNDEGVAGGYLGVGLDQWGNFANDGEGRGQNCQPGQQSPRRAAGWNDLVRNSVTLRGPGNGLSGYCWLETKQLPDNLAIRHATDRSQSKRTVEITLSPEEYPTVNVTIDGNQIINRKMTDPAPETWKFGFAGSTGSVTDVHLIGNLEAFSTTRLPDLNLVKTIKNKQQVYKVGDEIEYQFVVNNTTTRPMTDVKVNDPKVPAISCPKTTLDAVGQPGASMECSATHVVTKQDVRDGAKFENTAVATAAGGVTSPESKAVVDLTPAVPGISLAKSVKDQKAYKAGEQVQYGFEVTNTGDTVLTNVQVNDPLVGAVACPKTELGFDEKMTCTANYPVTQEHVDAQQQLVNVATVTAKSPNGSTVNSEQSQATVSVEPSKASIKVDKTAALNDVNGNDAADAGETITYTLKVTNTGNQTVQNVSVDDPMLGGKLDCEKAALAPGESTTCPTQPYTVTQADVDAQKPLQNTATASATDPAGNLVVDTPGTAETGVTEGKAALKLTKSAKLNDANGDQLADAGETIEYSLQVTNTGNVTVNTVAVNDPLLGGNQPCEKTQLAPGESTNCPTKPYTVTQANVDAQQPLTNTATASAVDGAGKAVDPVSATTSTQVAKADASIKLEKTGKIDDANNNKVADLGETIEYTFVVTNTGNVSVNDITVEDPTIGQVNCDSTELAPGKTVNCKAEAKHTVTQADIDAGGVKNVATAKAKDPSGGEVTSTPQEETTATPAGNPSIKLDKTSKLNDANGNEFADAGETIEYTLQVTNTGNVTVNTVAVDDPLLGGDQPCDKTQLAPGESTVCPTKPYTVTQDDVDAGKVKNTATATARVPGKQDDGGNSSGGDDDQQIDVSNPADNEVLTTPAAPAMNVVKMAVLTDKNGNEVGDPGETIRYQFEVTNTGNVTWRDLKINDPMVGEVTCEQTSLAPGATTNCQGSKTYTISVEDTFKGKVVNKATAAAEGVIGGSAADDSEVTVPVTPAKQKSGEKAGEKAAEKTKPTELPRTGVGSMNAMFGFALLAPALVLLAGVRRQD